jgi:hypothetical protein
MLDVELHALFPNDKRFNATLCPIGKVHATLDIAQLDDMFGMEI